MGKLLKSKKTIFIALIAVLATAVIIFSRQTNHEPIEIFALSAIVVDANSGRVLYEKNPHLRLLPSTLTFHF